MIDRSVMGRISQTWLDAERKSHPDRRHLVIATKRPKLKHDQERVAHLFGKTKFRSNLVALVDDAGLVPFKAASQFCSYYEL